jgi:hypothetical protein
MLRYDEENLAYHLLFVLAYRVRGIRKQIKPEVFS